MARRACRSTIASVSNLYHLVYFLNTSCKPVVPQHFFCALFEQSLDQDEQKEQSYPCAKQQLFSSCTNSCLRKMQILLHALGSASTEKWGASQATETADVDPTWQRIGCGLAMLCAVLRTASPSTSSKVSESEWEKPEHESTWWHPSMPPFFQLLSLC
jgi:hypothetical protein